MTITFSKTGTGQALKYRIKKGDYILLLQKIQALETALEDTKMVSFKVQQVAISQCFFSLVI